MSELPRDILINCIYQDAQVDKEIFFLTADFGAKALDQFRKNLPKQFIQMGISEQNMIDVAAGMSVAGLKVNCYAMACFITNRCLEQIKVALGCMKTAVNLIGVGCGFSYENAGPTHYATDDIATIRAILGSNIYSPSDNSSLSAIYQHIKSNPSLNYIRLERHTLKELPGDLCFNSGLKSIISGKSKVAVISNGHLLSRCYKAIEEVGLLVDLYDLFALSSTRQEILGEKLRGYEKIFIFEENQKNGALGSYVSEALIDKQAETKVYRQALQDQYFFENGGREYLLELNNLSLKGIKKILKQNLL